MEINKKEREREEGNRELKMRDGGKRDGQATPGTPHLGNSVRHFHFSRLQVNKNKEAH